jgi:hypothetical protein
MAILDDVKTSLRISNVVYDSEIEDLISAGKSDLRLAGIVFDDETAEKPLDALVKRAIITYCKANFGYDNPEAVRFNDSYVMLKQHLCLAGDYHEPIL